MTDLFSNMRDRMTPQQLYLHTAFEDDAKALFIQLLSKAKAYRDAIVPLPHENENGTRVVHGCNMAMKELGSNYFEAARSLKPYIDRDWVDIETERLGFRMRGFYARPMVGEWSYINKAVIE